MAIIGLTQTNQPASLALFNNSRGVISPRSSGWKMSNIRFYKFSNTMTVL